MNRYTENLKAQNLSIRANTQHFPGVSISGKSSFLDKLAKTKTMQEDARPSAFVSRKTSMESLNSANELVKKKVKRKMNLSTEKSIDSLKDIDCINKTLNQSRLAPELEYAHLIGKN
jgi:hypothetical protein